jgi:ATP-dependent exoDNAse (exonuclease V) beta subunit
MNRFDIYNNISISAGAGTGKTFTLSRRYINILLGFNFFGDDTFDRDKAESRSADPSEIVTITYTEAGAGEMQERIIQLISEIVSHIDGTKSDDKGILEQLNRHNQAQAYILEKLTKAKTRMIYANISTIHSFALNIIKRNVNSIGADSALTIIPEIEKSEMFDKVLTYSFEQHEKEIEYLVKYLGLFKLNLVAAKYIYDRKFREYLDNFQKTGYCPDEMLQLYRRIVTTHYFRDMIHICRQLDELQMHISNPQSFSKYLDYISIVFTIENYDDRATSLRFSKDQDEQKAQYGGIKKIVNEIRGKALELDENIETIFSNCLDKIHAILSSCYKLYVVQLIEQSMVDFDLILSIASDIIGEGSANESYKYFMVDEFQDTNEMQWDMITKLAACANIFIVGDEKQSIFSFQGAEVEIFQKAASDIDAVTIPITDNWRSSKTILDFVNETFATLFANKDCSYEDIADSRLKGILSNAEKLITFDSSTLKYEKLTYPAVKSDTDDDTAITYLVCEDTWSDEDSEQSMYEAEYENIALFLYKIKKGYLKEYYSITHLMNENKKAVAILFDSRTGMEILQEKLEKYGLTSIANFDIDFYKTKEVAEIYHMIRTVVSLQKASEWKFVNKFSLAGALRGCCMRYDDNKILDIIRSRDLEKVKEIFKRFLSAARQLPIHSFISYIVEETDLKTIYRHFDGYEQRIANINKLISIAYEFESNNLADYEKYIKDLERMIFFTDKSGQGCAAFNAEGKNSIELTTIHSSKGLQYPMVIVPQLSKRLTSAAASDSFKIGKVNVENSLQRVLGFKVNETDTITYSVASFIANNSNIAEKIRLFYVACTRAEKYLTFSVPQTSKNESTSYLNYLFRQYDINISETVDEFIEDGETDTISLVRGISNARLLKLSQIEYKESKFFDYPEIAVLPNQPVISFESAAPAEEKSVHHQLTFSTANKLGTAFHELAAMKFDQIEDNKEIEDAVRVLGSKFKLSEEQINDLRRFRKNFISHEIYPEIKNADKRYFELWFSLPDERGIVKNGAIDLLYQYDGKWKIIDFKTNSLQGRTAEEVKVANGYDKQLEQYTKAVKSLLDIDVDSADLMFLNV